MELQGRNAIVTGASRGLGTYIARALAAKGVNLALAARDASKLETTRAEAEGRGVRAIAVPTDVTSREDLRRLVETAERELGPVDIVVNNAGIEVSAPLVEHSFDQIDAVLRTNLSAAIWLTKMAVPGMVARGRGHIVNLASMAGKGGYPFITIYSASKAGLIAFSRGLDQELDGTGVRVSAVCPGFVSEAGMWADHSPQKAPFIAREVRPEKVAKAVLKALDGSPELFVTSGPIRPVIAFAELAPSMTKGFFKRTGLTALFRSEAERRREGHDRGATPASNGAAIPAEFAERK